jgi:hypothetical protein
MMGDLRERLQEAAEAATSNSRTPGPQAILRRGRQRRRRQTAGLTAVMALVLIAGTVLSDRLAGPTAPFGAPPTSRPSEVTATSRYGPNPSYALDPGEVQSPVGVPPGTVGEQMVADVASELARCRGGDPSGPKVLIAWGEALDQTWLVMAKPPQPGDKRLCWSDGLFEADGEGGIGNHRAPPELLQVSVAKNLLFDGAYWSQVVGAVTKRAARVQVHFDSGASPLELVPIKADDRFPVNFYAGAYRQPKQYKRPASSAVTRVVAYDNAGQKIDECQPTPGPVERPCG